MLLIQSFQDSDATPQAYAEYLRHNVEVARRTLLEPVQQWPRGSSHDISRQIIAEAQEAYSVLAIERGLYDATGKLSSFA